MQAIGIFKRSVGVYEREEEISVTFHNIGLLLLGVLVVLSGV